MEELSKPALDAVMNDTVQFHPPKFKNSYRHWMENVKDWCISRQLWWGTKSPRGSTAKAKKTTWWPRPRKKPWSKAQEKSGRPDMAASELNRTRT